MGRLASLLLLPLLVVEIQCQQTFPIVSFRGQTLANHSYVDISQVGASGNGSVQCHTDLTSCCSLIEGSHHGQWYFPNETTLENSNQLAIYQHNTNQRVELHRNSVNGLTGIYTCEIGTNAFYDNVARVTVYVGLYTCEQGKYNCLNLTVRFEVATPGNDVSV